MPTPPAPSGTAEPHAVVVQGLTKVYPTGGEPVRALDGVDVSFARGAFTAIMGPSGSGKSTLMHCMAGLDTPTSGSVRLGATELTALSDKQLTLLRRDRIGFVFQSFNLLPMLTARQNILLPSQISKRKVDPERFRHIVEVTGLADRLEHLPAKLSGGQQQRVAVARALAAEPRVVLADEPTANLDSKSGLALIELMKQLNAERGITFLFSTHDPRLLEHVNRIVRLEDGRVVADERVA